MASRPILLLPLFGMALIGGTAAPASPRPCRDQAGRIITCPKPPAKPVPPRCKDDKGRFVACKPAAPTGGTN